MSYLRIKSSLLIVSLAALTACGGGGSGGSITLTKYPVDLAVSDFNQMPHTFDLKASLGSDNYVLNLTLTPGSQATFDGVQAMTLKSSVTESKNGTVTASNSGTDYFLTTPFTQLGASLASGLTEIDSGQKALPEFAEDGDSGALDTQKYYSSSSLTTEVGTGTRTWALTALTSDTAQFCITDTDDLNGLETEIDCYDLDSKGNVTGIQVTFQANGQSITFK